MSTSDEPILKRKRAETLEAAAMPVVPVRSDIWYDDGNVVLQAAGTQFKVHKSILAQSSSVFNDMFSFPQPPSVGTELVEGCPIVHLSDSAEDVKYVLEALFQREYVSYGKGLPVAVVSAFLCLGRKYDIHKLRIYGQERIYREYPLALVDYDAAYNSQSPSILYPLSRFELVNLARKAELLSILPALLYECCLFYSASGIPLRDKLPKGLLMMLSNEDQLAFFTGYHAIYEAQAKTTYSWAYDGDDLSGRCIGDSCIPTRQYYLISRFTPVPPVAGLELWDESAQSEDMCEACTAGAKELHDKGREKFWALLPSLFGLPPWEELAKEREEL